MLRLINFLFVPDFMGSLEGTFDTKLHEAVRYGDLDEVKVALQQGYDPNLIGLYQWSALHEAANNGELDILKLLIAKKGKVTTYSTYSQ
jgi:ankyrin repeat protein